MTSAAPIRDPKNDWLLTPENSVLVVIDYQPIQVHSINSMNTGELIKNITLVCKTANYFKVPTVLTTVNVKGDPSKDTLDCIKQAIPGAPSIDRTTMNSWEDTDFVNAVKATGRKKIIMCALWTEVCLAFPTIDAIQEGFEVYPVVDAVAGTTTLAHETALRRVEQAGAHLITVPQLICELQRDWNRHATVKGFLDLMFESGAFLGL